MLGLYAAAMAGFSAWWFFGQFMLWRVTRAARPVPSAVRDLLLAIAGPKGARVRLFASDKIALPFTYTLARPVILLPTTLCDSRGIGRPPIRPGARVVARREARFLGVELHLPGGARSVLSALVLVAAETAPPLPGLPRRRPCRRDGFGRRLRGLPRRPRTDPPVRPSLPALGIGDRHSNLYRRVIMLVQNREPLEDRCRLAWSVTAAAIAAAVIVAASGLRLDAAAPPDDKPAAKEAKAVQDVAKPPADPKANEETLHYKGIVKSKDTGKPIAGATVVVRRSSNRAGENKVLQETRHATAADGTYAFTIPPEQVSDRFLYIELDVEHPDYATRAGFGYALGMIRKNEGLGERPFFETVELRPAQPITGRVETPEGAPAVGVDLLAYSKTNKLTKGHFEYGSFAKAKTDADGKFRLPITTPGQGVYWVLPSKYAPEMHVLADGKRGDLGDDHLDQGRRRHRRCPRRAGQTARKPAHRGPSRAGNRPRFRGPRPDDGLRRDQPDDRDRCPGAVHVSIPFPPAPTSVMPTTFDSRADRSAGRTRRDLPAVFTPKKLTINEGETLPPLEVRAAPYVVIEGQWLDSKGQPKSGWESSVFGQFDGTFWHDMAHPDAQGKFSLKVPHGLENTQLDVMTNEHASARHRIGKDAPLKAGRNVSSARSTTTSRGSRLSDMSRRSSSSTPPRRTASRSRVSKPP